jgi:predicted glycoside hydrolase/deacetylase ChbG (UPF0249 family)
MLIITADDYGTSLGYSEKVLELISKGYVNSISVIVNLEHFEFLAKKLDPYLKTLNINCHLNISEGKPIALSPESKLVNSEGYFYLDIKSLSILYLFSSFKQKSLILQDIRREFLAQIETFLLQFPNRPLNIDSHQHVHLLPFVFSVVNDLSVFFNSSNIRLGRSLTTKPGLSFSFFCRKIIFNLLSRKAGRLSSTRSRSQFILGVNELNSWSESMFFTIRKLVELNPNLTYELVAHPGWKDIHEIDKSDPQFRFLKHYTSYNRQIEYFLIMKHQLNDLLT